jgi:uncharacterized protein (TIGR04255 family)
MDATGPVRRFAAASGCGMLQRMPLRYQKPPLVEALCELRFTSAAERPWDWAVPGLLYSKIAERFPTRRQQQTIELPMDGVPPVASMLAQFVATDESMMVQVGPDLLAVNSLRSHVGWHDLKAMLLDVLRAYREIAAPAGLSGAAVRYINRVEIPIRPGFALEQYFSVLPGRPPEGVPPDVSTFLIHTEAVCDDPAAIFRFRFGTTDSAAEIAAFMLDYEHVAVAGSFEALSSWLDAGHARIEKAFYSSFTALTHAEIFQEIRN